MRQQIGILENCYRIVLTLDPGRYWADFAVQGTSGTHVRLGRETILITAIKIHGY